MKLGSNGRLALVAGLAGLLLGGGAVALFDKRAQPPEAFGDQVRAYLLEHPEVLPEAMARLQDRETGRLVSAQRAAIERPFGGAWAGAAEPDVTLVQFFDYACSFCRASVPDLERLLAEDKGVRVVFRELPILGPGSEEAAKASLQAAKTGNYMAFHRAMYAAGTPTPERVAAVGAAAGIGSVEPAPDVTREIESNVELARMLQLTGTPAFVVGDRVLNGAVGYDALKQAIADERAKRG